MNVTEKQKKILLEYMKKNKDIACGRLRYNSSNKKILEDTWFAITTSLNSLGSGPQRQSKEWQKTWRDWKASVLKKYAANCSYANGTGTGPAQIIHLTEIEEDLLVTIDETPVELPAIPEGGCFDRAVPHVAKRLFEDVEPQESVQIKRKHDSPMASDYANVAVELMREQLRHKREKIEISKEKLRLKKEKFEFTKNAHTQYLDILGDINQNITLLRQEVEKIAPSYLE